jgi:hypothetical protein
MARKKSSFRMGGGRIFFISVIFLVGLIFLVVLFAHKKEGFDGYYDPNPAATQQAILAANKATGDAAMKKITNTGQKMIDTVGNAAITQMDLDYKKALEASNIIVNKSNDAIKAANNSLLRAQDSMKETINVNKAKNLFDQAIKSRNNAKSNYEEASVQMKLLKNITKKYIPSNNPNYNFEKLVADAETSFNKVQMEIEDARKIRVQAVDIIKVKIYNSLPDKDKCKQNCVKNMQGCNGPGDPDPPFVPLGYTCQYQSANMSKCVKECR